MGLACNRNNVDPCLAIRKIPCSHCSFVVHLIGIPELDFRERNPHLIAITDWDNESLFGLQYIYHSKQKSFV